ncbi:MAG: glucosyltransferase domain-containing protein [Roseburia sp.]|nr:glucosyltransferase domain-containing protein [Roseburia sp.]
MRQWREDFLYFVKNKIYLAALFLTGLCCYGFLITHQTVGIDDTPYAYYFEEGLVAIVGRWVLFLLNKWIHISDFGPFMMDLCGALVLMLAATVWCVLFYSIWRERIPFWGYLFFACFLIANPLHSEVFTYYLHNGVALGYLCCGLSLTLLRRGFSERKVGAFLGAGLLLWVSVGCYESFMVVWLVGFLLMLLSERYGGMKRRIFPALCMGAAVAVAAILLRSVMIAAVTGVFGLQDMKEEAVQRSLGEMLSWVFDSAARDEFVMALKRVFVMYGAFAYAYLPIALFVLAAFIMLVGAVIRTVRKREAWTLLLTLGCFIACFLLVLIEGSVTLYRSAQFLPLVCAYGVLLAAYGLNQLQNIIKSRLQGKGNGGLMDRGLLFGRGFFGVVVSVLLFNQCMDMNQWFYVDYLKYEDARNTVNWIAYELERNYDISKPVVFTGTYKVPQSIIQAAYVPYGSETFYKINNLTGLIDEHLLEKFYREYGVWVAQTPSLSVLDWARYAFDTDEEMARFFAMHGHTVKPLTDTSLYAKAEEYSLKLPDFPAKGSIVDRGDYIIVHF